MSIQRCVFCDSSTDLNTSLIVTLDNGHKITVLICDTHAEEATVKSARDAYLDKRKKIDDIIAQAKVLGVDLTENSPVPITSVSKREVSQHDNIDTQESNNIINPNNLNVIPTSKLDGKKFQSSGGSVNGMMVTGYSAFDPSALTDKLPGDVFDGYAEMAVVEGRSGQPLSIPQLRVDKTGTTQIAIVKTTDGGLQDRFKKMANSTLSDSGPDFAKSGYNNTQRQCPICHGSGFIKQNKNSTQCPKCKGAGLISVY